MNLLQKVQCLLIAFQERNERQHWDSDAVQQRQHDATFHAYCSSFHDFAFEKWHLLCDGIGFQPALIAVATHCQNFSWEPVGNWIVEKVWSPLPMTQIATAASFCKKVGLPENAKDIPLSKILNAQQRPEMTTFLLFVLDGAPAFDVAKNAVMHADPQITQVLAWLWARDGYGDAEYEILRAWVSSSQYDIGLRFWALFALVLRHPAQHDLASDLQKLTEGEAARKQVAAATQQALLEGPFTPETARAAFDNLTDGARNQRLIRALRFAAFVPGTAPLVDPSAPWQKQEQQAARLRVVLQQVISSGASFTPAVYAEKAYRTHALKTEADKHEKKLKERMAPRGWSESAISEALAHGPGIPVLGYSYGPALLRFHPETHLPIVTCAETNEVIHIGRADYVYDIDKDAHQAIPEAERPPLPAWREPSPSTADLTPVYVRLKNEWIDVWRPVDGRWVERNVYCLMPHGIPEDETQEFWIGHHVECTIRRFGNGIGQAATKLAERR